MNVLSLFSGIGGLELGLERAGMTVVGQVEIDPFCRRVLAKHWPEVPRHDDVRTAVEWWLGGERPAVDVVCGGFPCQPVSNAGKRLGEDDERWLWPAYLAVIRALRPRYAVMENVAALLGRGAGTVLGDLASSGYDAEWDCVPAAAVGAPHLRDRWFAVAYPSTQAGRRVGAGRGEQQPEGGEAARALADTDHKVHVKVSPGRRNAVRRPGQVRADASGHGAPVADSDGSTRRSAEGHALINDGSGALRERSPQSRGRGNTLADTDRQPPICTSVPRPVGDHWTTEPDVGRVAHGVPARVDRLRALGNAVVPQVAEHIGRLILPARTGRTADAFETPAEIAAHERRLDV